MTFSLLCYGIMGTGFMYSILFLAPLRTPGKPAVLNLSTISRCWYSCQTGHSWSKAITLFQIKLYALKSYKNRNLPVAIYLDRLRLILWFAFYCTNYGRQKWDMLFAGYTFSLYELLKQPQMSNQVECPSVHQLLMKETQTLDGYRSDEAFPSSYLLLTRNILWKYHLT